MAGGENARSVAAARSLRRRWLDEPSPPIAVDDEPYRSPESDVTGDGHGAEDDLESPASVPAV
jgi:hypothetical protein